MTGWALLGGKLAPAAGDALVAVGLLLACGLIGFSLLPAGARERARLALPLSLSLGVTAVGWGSWLAGSLAGTRATLPLLVILVLQSLRIWRGYARACLRWARTAWLLARSQPWLAAALMLVVAALGPQLLLPVTDSDGLRYHLALPKLFVLTGTVFRYQYDFTGGLPQLAEMLYLHTLQLGRAETAKLLHTGMFLGTLAVLAAVVHRGPGTRPAALLAPLAWAATPLALTVAATSFVDHFAAFHCAVALLLAAAGSSPVLIGCALGGALGTKLTVVPFAVGVAGAVICSAGRRRALRTAALLLLPVALVLAPFAIRNAIDTGDPFFPLGRGLLGLPVQGASASRVELSTHYHPASTGFLGITWGAAQGKASGDEIAGWHNLVALLALVLAVRDRRMRLFATPVAFTLLLGFGFRPPTRLRCRCFSALRRWGRSRWLASGGGPRTGRRGRPDPGFRDGRPFGDHVPEAVQLSFRSHRPRGVLPAIRPRLARCATRQRTAAGRPRDGARFPRSNVLRPALDRRGDDGRAATQGVDRRRPRRRRSAPPPAGRRRPPARRHAGVRRRFPGIAAPARIHPRGAANDAFAAKLAGERRDPGRRRRLPGSRAPMKRPARAVYSVR